MHERIKMVRKGMGYTMEEFAERIGMSKGSISLIEAGKRTPTSQVIKAIVNTFGVNETWLLTGDGEPFAPRTKEQQIADYVVDSLDEYEEDAEVEEYRGELIDTIKGFNIVELMLLKRMIDRLAAVSIRHKK